MLFKYAVIVDTSAYFALIDSKDTNHSKALHFVKNNVHPLVTTNYIIVETLNLINQRLGHKFAIEIGQQLFDSEATCIINITAEDMKKAWDIFQSYDDKKFSYTDCTTFSIMERLKILSAFAFDKHFRQYNQSKLQVFP